jgi:hypothetical protein
MDGHPKEGFQKDILIASPSWNSRNRRPRDRLPIHNIGADTVTLTNSPLLAASHRSGPYVIWRWVPEGPQYVSQTPHDPATGITRKTISLDVREGAILGMTLDGKFMVGEVVRNPTAP